MEHEKRSGAERPILRVLSRDFATITSGLHAAERHGRVDLTPRRARRRSGAPRSACATRVRAVSVCAPLPSAPDDAPARPRVPTPTLAAARLRRSLSLARLAARRALTPASRGRASPRGPVLPDTRAARSTSSKPRVASSWHESPTPAPRSAYAPRLPLGLLSAALSIYATPLRRWPLLLSVNNMLALLSNNSPPCRIGFALYYPSRCPSPLWTRGAPIHILSRLRCSPQARPRSCRARPPCQLPGPLIRKDRRRVVGLRVPVLPPHAGAARAPRRSAPGARARRIHSFARIVPLACRCTRARLSSPPRLATNCLLLRRRRQVKGDAKWGPRRAVSPRPYPDPARAPRPRAASRMHQKVGPLRILGPLRIPTRNNINSQRSGCARASARVAPL